MATPEHKAFRVLQFAKSESAISVQRAFHLKFNCDPHVAKTSANGIGNSKRLDVFVKGKARDDQKCL